MSRVRLANNDTHPNLAVPEFGGPSGNINLAITRTTTTFLSLPGGQIQPIAPLVPVNFFPNSHPFKMNASATAGLDLHDHSEKLVSNDRSAVVSSSQTPLGGLVSGGGGGGGSGNNVGGGVVGGNGSGSATSYHRPLTAQEARELKIKNKARQPKYRSTKRPPSERKFKCDHCESRFFTQKDVKRHLVVHTGVRNFACPYCTQRFGRKDHLVRHAKKSHNEDTRSFRRKNARQHLLGGAGNGGLGPTSSGHSGGKRNTARARKSTHKNGVKDSLALVSGVSPMDLHDSDLTNTIQHHYHHHHHLLGDASSTANYTPSPLASSFYPTNGGAVNAFDATSTHPVSAQHHHHFMSSSVTSGTHYVANSSIGNAASALAVAASLSKSQLTGNYHSPGAYDTSAAGTSAFQYNPARRPGQFIMDATAQQYPFHLTSPSSAYYSTANGFYSANSNATLADSSAHIAQTSTSQASAAAASAAVATSLSSSTPGHVSFKSVTNTVVDGFNVCIDPDYLQSVPSTSAATNMVNLTALNASSLHPTSANLVPGSAALESRFF